MKTPHKHAELIKQWADGAEIEFNNYENNWITVGHPGWGGEKERYRIKPEPKPDPVLFYSVKDYDDSPDVKAPKVKWTGSRYDSNLHLTFNAETGKLIKAEVI